MQGSATAESEGQSKLAREHAIQRGIARLVAPLWVPAAALYLRVFRGYRIEGLARAREQFQRIRAEYPGPMLVCANHLTLVDSFLVAWALASPWHYLRRFDDLAWNTPERANFASTRGASILAYLAKCVPISRGGDRGEVADVLERIAHLLRGGELALVFPEGKRSRSGRFETEGLAWGVGRLVGSVPDCRVLCVYLRGRAQETFGDWPRRGDRFRVSLRCIEPKSDARGVRRTRDYVQQIGGALAEMEKDYFDGRQ